MSHRINKVLWHIVKACEDLNPISFNSYMELNEGSIIHTYYKALQCAVHQRNRHRQIQMFIPWTLVPYKQCRCSSNNNNYINKDNRQKGRNIGLNYHHSDTLFTTEFSCNNWRALMKEKRLGYMDKMGKSDFSEYFICLCTLQITGILQCHLV